MRLSLTRLLSPITSPTVATVVEALALPLLMLVAGAWINPADPLFANGDFPWPWLAPLLIALRYGPMWGIASAGILLAGWFVLEGGGHGSHELPKLYFLGGLILTLLAGEFASIWQARLRRAETTRDYLERRLDALTHSHYLLRLSHESLEQDLLSRPVSMRDALVGLRNLVAGIDERRNEPLPASAELLKLTVQFCQIEHAALVPIDDGHFIVDDATFLGAGFLLDEADPLVRHALDTELMSHVASQAAERREDSRYLVVAPVRDITGHLRALMIIENLPFLALQEENLQVLNLMLCYYADSLALAPLVAPLQARWPRCPSAFALELQRLDRLQREAAVPSALIAMSFPAAGLPEDLPIWMLQQQRSLDVTWMIEDEKGRPHTLLSLLPLAQNAAVEGYFARIERATRSIYDKDLGSLGIHSRVWHLGQDTPLALLAKALEASDVAA